MKPWPCDCCRRADLYRETPYRVFDPSCLWCGARYFQALQAWPAVEVTGGLGEEPRRETKDERRAWQARVLDLWERHGHPREKVRTMALQPELPIQPEKDRRK